MNCRNACIAKRKPKSSKAHSKHEKRDYHEDEGDMVYACNDAYCEFRKRVHSKTKDKVKAKLVHVFVDDQDGVLTGEEQDENETIQGL